MSAEDGDRDSQYILGYCYTYLMDPPQYDEAIKWMKMCAEQDVPYAQAIVGWIYSSEEYEHRSWEESAKWFKRGADNGD